MASGAGCAFGGFIAGCHSRRESGFYEKERALCAAGGGAFGWGFAGAGFGGGFCVFGGLFD